MPLKYCEGTGKKPNKRTEKIERRWYYSAYGDHYNRIRKYKCPVCKQHVGLDTNGMIYRHGHKVTPDVVKERKRAKALKTGEYFSLCAECENPVFEADYLCEDCRAAEGANTDHQAMA